MTQVYGKVLEDGYAIMDGEREVKRYSLDEANTDQKLKSAIKRLKWPAIPEKAQ